MPALSSTVPTPQSAGRPSASSRKMCTCTRSRLSAAEPCVGGAPVASMVSLPAGWQERQSDTAVRTRKQVAHLGASIDSRPVPRNAICMPDPLLSNLRLRSCVISSRVLHISSGGGLCGLALAGRAGPAAAAAPAAAAEELLGLASAALAPAVFLVDCSVGTFAGAATHDQTSNISTGQAHCFHCNKCCLASGRACVTSRQQHDGPTFLVAVLPLLSLTFFTAEAVCV